MKFLISIGLILLVLTIGTLISFLGAYIIIDVAKLYSIDFISQYSVTQMFCVMMIMSLIRYKYVKNEEDNDVFDVFMELLSSGFNRALVFLIGWAMLYIVHSIVL